MAVRQQSFYLGKEGDIFQSAGQDASAHGQHPAALCDPALKTAGDGSHRRDKQVAKTVPGQPVGLLLPHIAFGKTILEQPRHQPFHLAERRNVVAEISRRQGASLPTQPPAAAAIVRHRDNGSQVVRVRAQPSQQLRHASSPADRNDTGPVPPLLAMQPGAQCPSVVQSRLLWPDRAPNPPIQTKNSEQSAGRSRPNQQKTPGHKKKGRELLRTQSQPQKQKQRKAQAGQAKPSQHRQEMAFDATPRPQQKQPIFREQKKKLDKLVRHDNQKSPAERRNVRLPVLCRGKSTPCSSLSPPAARTAADLPLHRRPPSQQWCRRRRCMAQHRRPQRCSCPVPTPPP